MFVGGGTVQAAGGFKKLLFFFLLQIEKTSNIGFETVHVFHSRKKYVSNYVFALPITLNWILVLKIWIYNSLLKLKKEYGHYLVISSSINILFLNIVYT